MIRTYKKYISMILAVALVAVMSIPSQAFAAESSKLTVMYTTWENAVVINDGETAEFVPEQYNNDFTAAQLWFAVNVERPGQAITMNFSGLENDTDAYLFDGNVLNSGASPSYDN